MNSRIVLLAITLLLLPAHGACGEGLPVDPGLEPTAARASAANAFEALENLQGRWRGEGDGKWGTSRAEKVIVRVLDGKALCRQGVSVYPKQEKNPDGETHRAHALITPVEGGGKLLLTEYDNEGFIARYALDLSASESGSSWVFELEQAENLPPGMRARLTLRLIGEDRLSEVFELDFSGEGYVTYLTNRLTRVPGSESDGALSCTVP